MEQKALFLDRDGTVIEHIPYLADPEGLKFKPTVVEALRAVSSAGFLLILVTNQSAIARGLLSEEKLMEIHARLDLMFKSNGIDLAAIFYCPHHPDDNCVCRKPKPGMILDAARKFNICLEKSFMVGDDPKDIEAGSVAGCKTVFIEDTVPYSGIVVPTFEAVSMGEAAEFILGEGWRA